MRLSDTAAGPPSTGPRLLMATCESEAAARDELAAVEAAAQSSGVALAQVQIRALASRPELPEEEEGAWAGAVDVGMLPAGKLLPAGKRELSSSGGSDGASRHAGVPGAKAERGGLSPREAKKAKEKEPRATLDRDPLA